MPPTPGRTTSPTRRSWPASTRCIVEQARAPRRASRQSRAGSSTLDQPTYVAVVTDAESSALRRAFYEAWTHARLGPGPERRPLGQRAGHGRHPAAAPRGGAAARISPAYAEYALATRMARSVAGGARVPARAGARRRAPPPSAEFAELEAFAGRTLEAWDVGYYSERLQREPLHGLAGGAARRTCRCRACWRACSRWPSGCSACASRERHGVPVWHRGRALLRDPGRRAARRSAASTWTPTRARTSAAAPGWTSASAASTSTAGADAAGRLPGVQLPAAAGERPALLTHDDVRDAVPRVRPRPASHADARRLSEPGRHQRRRLGCGRAAQPVHGELRLAAGRAAAHLGARRERRSRCRPQQQRAADRHAQLPGRAADAAAGGVRAVRLAPARRVRPRSAAAASIEILAEVRARGRGGAGAGLEPLPAQLRAHLRRRLRRRLLQLQVGRGAGGRCLRGLRGAAGAFDRATAQRFLDASSRAAAAATRSRRSSNFAAASPRSCARCCEQHGILGAPQARRA